MEKDVEKLNKKSTNPLNDKKNAQQTIKGFMVAFTLKLAESQNQIPVVEKAETAKKEVKDHPQTQNQEAIAKAKEQNQQHQKVEAMIQEQYQDHHVFVSANVKEGEILGKKGSEKLNKELSNAIIAANVSGVKNEQMDNKTPLNKALFKNAIASNHSTLPKDLLNTMRKEYKDAM
ncbi:hypothetical protein ACQJ9A_05720 [Helicobacter pylori]